MLCLPLLAALVQQLLVATVRLTLLLLATTPVLFTAGILQQFVLEAGPFVFPTAWEVGAVEFRDARLFVERRFPSCVELLPFVLVPSLQFSVDSHAVRVTLVRHQSRVVLFSTGFALLRDVLDRDRSEILQEFFDGFPDLFVRPNVAFLKQRLTSSLANLGSAVLKRNLWNATFTAKLGGFEIVAPLSEAGVQQNLFRVLTGGVCGLGTFLQVACPAFLPAVFF